MAMIKMLAVAVLVAGCSVSLQKKPSAGKVSSADCSTTSAYWIADTALAGAGIATGAAVTAYSIAEDGSDMMRLAAGVGLVSSMIYLASAERGRAWSAECAAIGERAPVATR